MCGTELGDRGPLSHARILMVPSNRTTRRMPEKALRGTDFSTKCCLMCTIVVLLEVVRWGAAIEFRIRRLREISGLSLPPSTRPGANAGPFSRILATSGAARSPLISVV